MQHECTHCRVSNVRLLTRTIRESLPLTNPRMRLDPNCCEQLHTCIKHTDEHPLKTHHLTCCERLAQWRLRACSAHSSATSHHPPRSPPSNASAASKWSVSADSAAALGGEGASSVGGSLGQRRRPRSDWRYWISWVTWEEGVDWFE